MLLWIVVGWERTLLEILWGVRGLEWDGGGTKRRSWGNLMRGIMLIIRTMLLIVLAMRIMIRTTLTQRTKRKNIIEHWVHWELVRTSAMRRE